MPDAVKQWRFLYSPVSDGFGWKPLPGVASLNTEAGAAALVARWNAEQENGMQWRCEEVFPNDIDYQRGGGSETGNAS